jgi:hypothetical protein
VTARSVQNEKAGRSDTDTGSRQINFSVKRREIKGRVKNISVNWGQIWPANTVIRTVFVKTKLDQNVHLKETSTSNHIP